MSFATKSCSCRLKRSAPLDLGSSLALCDVEATPCLGNPSKSFQKKVRGNIWKNLFIEANWIAAEDLSSGGAGHNLVHVHGSHSLSGVDRSVVVEVPRSPSHRRVRPK